ncbi:molybdate ABC transporter substrate-binding protein [Phycobacter sp. K97]|uniref:molybdate ABC transporter substrate-binding protein n=1 Tax=Phycobacter sedimenti TaxID=3133977 RepID=UPI00311EE9DB
MMFSRIRRHMLAAVLGVFLVSLAPSCLSAGQITVFAPASMTNAMVRIRAEFESETGHRVLVSFAGSSVLARQIERGAPADVFLSANPAWMDYLDSKGWILGDTRFDLIGNRLVLIGHGSQPPVDLLSEGDLLKRVEGARLAMALTEAVPAGIYGKTALASMSLWNKVGPDVVQTDNVRAALALVATGEAPFGIVYATDARASSAVSVIATFPADSHPPIVYPAAAVAPGENPAALAFLEYLKTPAVQTILTDEGFSALPD